MRCAVVGHVEWVEFARVPELPTAGSIVHATQVWSEPAGGGAVVARLVPALTRTIGLLHRANPLTPSARAFVELARADNG